ncbi:hypothetical protein H9P43_004311 [Blastocladiella emersonii ATCC 22665]|nr:hypothetical protein H9P43_004311 [Blastocladiella emersonii ATCC 22665]
MSSTTTASAALPTATTAAPPTDCVQIDAAALTAGLPESARQANDACCGWRGVACSAPGQVRSIDWSGLGLNGTLPLQLALVSSLTSLNLSNNQLTGTIPYTYGTLVGLQTLALDKNSLTGPIPASLADLRDLRTLSLANNRLIGSVPSLPLSVAACELAGGTNAYSCYSESIPTPCRSTLATASVTACPTPSLPATSWQITMAVVAGTVTGLLLVVLAFAAFRYRRRAKFLEEEQRIQLVHARRHSHAPPPPLPPGAPAEGAFLGRRRASILSTLGQHPPPPPPPHTQSGPDGTPLALAPTFLPDPPPGLESPRPAPSVASSYGAMLHPPFADHHAARASWIGSEHSFDDYASVTGSFHSVAKRGGAAAAGQRPVTAGPRLSMIAAASAPLQGSSRARPQSQGGGTIHSSLGGGSGGAHDAMAMWTLWRHTPVLDTSAAAAAPPSLAAGAPEMDLGRPLDHDDDDDDTSASASTAVSGRHRRFTDACGGGGGDDAASSSCGGGASPSRRSWLSPSLRPAVAPTTPTPPHQFTGESPTLASLHPSTAKSNRVSLTRKPTLFLPPGTLPHPNRFEDGEETESEPVYGATTAVVGESHRSYHSSSMTTSVPPHAVDDGNGTDTDEDCDDDGSSQGFHMPALPRPIPPPAAPVPDPPMVPTPFNVALHALTRLGRANSARNVLSSTQQPIGDEPPRSASPTLSFLLQLPSLDGSSMASLARSLSLRSALHAGGSGSPTRAHEDDEVLPFHYLGLISLPAADDDDDEGHDETACEYSVDMTTLARASEPAMASPRLDPPLSPLPAPIPPGLEVRSGGGCDRRTSGRPSYDSQ